LASSSPDALIGEIKSRLARLIDADGFTISRVVGGRPRGERIAQPSAKVGIIEVTWFCCTCWSRDWAACRKSQGSTLQVTHRDL